MYLPPNLLMRFGPYANLGKCCCGSCCPGLHPDQNQLQLGLTVGPKIPMMYTWNVRPCCRGRRDCHWRTGKDRVVDLDWSRSWSSVLWVATLGLARPGIQGLATWRCAYVHVLALGLLAFFGLLSLQGRKPVAVVSWPIGINWAVPGSCKYHRAVKQLAPLSMLSIAVFTALSR